MTAASLSVAIIGAGPAGAYVAERLVRKNPAAQIDVIDRFFAEDLVNIVVFVRFLHVFCLLRKTL